LTLLYFNKNSPPPAKVQKDNGKFKGVKMGIFVPYPSHCIRGWSKLLFYKTKRPPYFTFLPFSCKISFGKRKFFQYDMDLYKVLTFSGGVVEFSQMGRR